MSAQSSPPGRSQFLGWPEDAAPYYRPTLFLALAACVGVVIGSIAPWMHVVIFGDVGGLDFQGWGVTTLILGSASAVALFTLLFWTSTPFGPRWAVPLAWTVALAAVVCLTDALINIIRIVTLEKPEFFGVTIGPRVGWGLWLLAFSSAALCATAFVVALQIVRNVNHGSVRGAAVAGVAGVSALVVVGGVGYALMNPFSGDDDLAGAGGTTSEASPFPNLFDEETTTTSPSEAPGPRSSTVKGLRLPSGSTLRATENSPDGDGGDTMEWWDVPLSFDDAEDYVTTEWSFDSISGLDRRHSGDEQGVAEDGAKFRKWEWVSDTAPARAILVRLYDTDDPGRSVIILGDFTDQDGDGSV